MTDEELREAAPTLPTMYFDGFGDYQKINGVLRCIGWVIHGGANLNLIVSLAGADQAQIDTQKTLRETPPTKGITIWRGHRAPH